MNDHVDVIEALRHLDPVPPGSIDEAHCATAAELRSMLHDRAATVPLTRFDDHRVRVGRFPWWKLAASIAVLGSAIAAVVLLDRESGSLRPAAPVTDPTVDNSAPGRVGESAFALTSPSADDVAQATDANLYQPDFAPSQVSSSGNSVSLRQCRDSASTTCGTGWAYVTEAADGGEVRGGLLGDASDLDLHLLDDRHFVASESAPGTQALAKAWLIDAVSGQVGGLTWRDEPTTLNSPEQALLLCEESYDSFATTCAFTQVWDDTPRVEEVGTVSAGGTTVTETSLVEGRYTYVPSEAGLPKVVDVRDGTIRPLAMPDNAVAALPVAQHGTGRIWVGTDPDPDDDRLGLAYSDDGGATWSHVTLPEPFHATTDELAGILSYGDDLLEIAADGDRVAVADSWGEEDNTVYVSDDAGESWTTATTEPGGNGVHLYVLADGRLVVMGSLDVYPSELLASTGSNWADLESVDVPFPDPGSLEDLHRFSINRAGIAMIRSYFFPCNGSWPCPGYTEDMGVVLDTIDFSADLTNWSTIDVPDE